MAPTARVIPLVPDHGREHGCGPETLSTGIVAGIRAPAIRPATTGVRTGAHSTDVLLVSMPFGMAFYPSLAFGLLKASLASDPVSVGVRYFTIPFAERIGHML